MDGERVTRLSGLDAYPIKSCRGIPLDVWDVDGRGLRLDRRWMLVDADGRLLTQRELPRMALIGVRMGSEHLAVDTPGMPRLMCVLNRQSTTLSPLASGTTT
jgi:uncharacterized protein